MKKECITCWTTGIGRTYNAIRNKSFSSESASYRERGGYKIKDQHRIQETILYRLLALSSGPSVPWVPGVSTISSVSSMWSIVEDPSFHQELWHTRDPPCTRQSPHSNQRFLLPRLSFPKWVRVLRTKKWIECQRANSWPSSSLDLGKNWFEGDLSSSVVGIIK